VDDSLPEQSSTTATAPKASRPIFRWRPLFVNGTPIRRESRAFAAERPIARLNQKPPNAISVLLSAACAKARCAAYT
jgi:hypothetical protein